MVTRRGYCPHLLRGIAFAFFLFLITAGFAAARSGKPPGSEPVAAAQQPPAGGAQPSINAQFGRPLAQESRQAAGEQENEQEKMEQELKESPSVRWMADVLHISPRAGYWLGVLLDFALLALILIYLLKKSLPRVFRARTSDIRRGLEAAAKASEEANQRLAQVEARLARLDEEIGAMRAAAEKEIADEEQRIRLTADEDKKRIVQGATAEIEAAAKMARRELRTFAADLAVELAERRIRVDAATDQALVRSFTGELAHASGKDGH